MNLKRATTLRAAAVIATLSVGALVLSGCTSTNAGSSTSTAKGDNGTALTMWARDTNGNVAQKMVDEYNRTHKNKVKLTIIPGANYSQKVGAAAGSHSLPDILSADVVYSPNYVQQGLFDDITKQVKGLPFYNKLAHAHTEAATYNNKIYGTPLVVDSSLIIYNKDLFAKAGLDPEKAPANFTDIYNDAKAVRDKVGGNTYGFYFGGNCAGCNAYSITPYAVAAGTPLFSDNGKKVSIDNPALTATVALYKRMYDEGIIPASAKGEDGSNWTTAFNAGQIGILPVGTFDFGALATAKFKWGVAELPAPDGSNTSTFVGGDVAGISKDSKHFSQAWNFLDWTLGEDDQVNVLAKSGNLPSRLDLADNKYSAANPAIVTAIKGEATGYTPSSTQYYPLINDGTGPWLKGIRDYIFNNKPDALTVAQKTAQSALDSGQ